MFSNIYPRDLTFWNLSKKFDILENYGYPRGYNNRFSTTWENRSIGHWSWITPVKIPVLKNNIAKHQCTSIENQI